MTLPSAAVLAAVLVATLCVIVGALVWQEAKRRGGTDGPTYVVENAVRFIAARLNPEAKQRVGVDGIRRIIEWEVYYLQGLAQEKRRNPVDTVAGGSDASIDYIVSRIAEVNQASYDRGDVADVLRLEADYLASIGAVGEAVDVDQYDKGEDEA